MLVNGASGTTGIAAIQIAKFHGAEVTAVCSSANFDLVTSVGADKVIDYTREDFTKNGLTYDIIVDTVGTAPWSLSKNSLNKTGRLLVIVGSLWAMIQAPFVSRKNGKSVITGTAISSADKTKILAILASEGKFKPVIDRTYPFEEIVEAYRYVDKGHKKGNVVITIGHKH